MGINSGLITQNIFISFIGGEVLKNSIHQFFPLLLSFWHSNPRLTWVETHLFPQQMYQDIKNISEGNFVKKPSQISQNTVSFNANVLYSLDMLEGIILNTKSILYVHSWASCYGNDYQSMIEALSMNIISFQ